MVCAISYVVVSCYMSTANHTLQLNNHFRSQAYKGCNLTRGDDRTISFSSRCLLSFSRPVSFDKWRGNSIFTPTPSLSYIWIRTYRECPYESHQIVQIGRFEIPYKPVAFVHEYTLINPPSLAHGYDGPVEGKSVPTHYQDIFRQT